MPLDLEHELLRAAQAFCASRDHVRDAERRGFTCAELLGFIEVTRTESTFPRISHRLVAYLVEGLAASLSQTGFLERVDLGRYALTDKAFGHLEREPAYLANELRVPGAAELTLWQKRR